jgi:hypothetical protein
VVSDVSNESAAFLLAVQKVSEECIIPKPLDLWEGRRPHSAIPDRLHPQAQPFRTQVSELRRHLSGSCRSKLFQNSCAAGDGMRGINEPSTS